MGQPKVHGVDVVIVEFDSVRSRIRPMLVAKAKACRKILRLFLKNIAADLDCSEIVSAILAFISGVS